MDGQTDSRRALVAGCLCRLCPTTEFVPARAYSLHKNALQYAWGRKTPLSLFDVPHVLGRIRHRKWVRKNRRIKGRSMRSSARRFTSRIRTAHGNALRTNAIMACFGISSPKVRQWNYSKHSSMKSILLIMFLDYISVQFQLAIYQEVNFCMESLFVRIYVKILW